MIFYYSATGNSKWFAERIAKALGDKTADIMKSDPASYSFTKDDYCGFVYPVFWCQAPDFVSEFAKKVNAGDAWTFVACTYSCQTGKSMQQFSKDCVPLKAGFGLLSPDNTSCIGLDYDTEETTFKKLSTIEERADAIIAHILAKDEIYESIEGDDPQMKTDTGLCGAKELFSTSKHYHVDADVCIGCGLCAENCPAGSIKMEDGKPVWFKNDCYVCVSCINNCPVEAIQYDDKSQGIYRYDFDKYMNLYKNKVQK